MIMKTLMTSDDHDHRGYHDNDCGHAHDHDDFDDIEDFDIHVNISEQLP